MDGANRRTSELVRLARDGDREALEELLERHRPYLRLVARRHPDPRFDASELIRQTCLSVHRDLDEFSGATADEFAAWIRAILETTIRNACRDQRAAPARFGGREEWGDNGDGLGVGPTGGSRPSQRLLQGEQAVRLAGAMERLTDDQREAIRLRFIEGCPLAELAGRLECTEQEAVGRVARGLQALRNTLREP